MPFDLDHARDFLADDAPAPAAWPPGAQTVDFTRSPAAARVGGLATEAGLFLFHYEHRAHLPIEADPEWQDGVLAERKYAGFRHDLMVGSFHPGHRGKWTTHELCHALVGCAWAPDARPLFHATAGRLAELVPVVLYYFLDEIRLRRCPDHADGGGALYRAFCPACERAAEQGPRDFGASDREALDAARRFLEHELAAVARSLRVGRPIAHRWGSLDLCTDGIAYARAHEDRLRSPAFHRYVERFGVVGVGVWETLDALEARALAVVDALCTGADLPTMGGDRWVWCRQDVGWRLLSVADALDGEARAVAQAIADGLADDPPGAEGLRRAYQSWQDGAEAGLPPADLVFAVGYPIPGGGRDQGSVREGLQTVTPLTLELFEDLAEDPVADFLAVDPAVRRPLGDRFAAWLAERYDGGLPTLARFESALRHASSAPLASLGGGSGPVRLGEGVRLLVESWDPVALADGVASGRFTAARVDGRVALVSTGEVAVPERSVHLLVARAAEGEVAVCELDADEAAGLAAGPVVLDPERASVLLDAGMVAPERWLL